MSALRQFALIAAALGLALAISGVLYLRSQSADFDRHAQAIEAVGSVRHLNELLTEQVLAARFGLLNQYDSLTATELALGDARSELRSRIDAVVGIDPALENELSELDQSSIRQRVTVERFKAENSVLKNSLYYLPTAAREVELALSAQSAENSSAIHELVQAALVYNLIGDQTTRDAHLRALERARSFETRVAEGVLPQYRTMLAHADVVGRRQISVDGAVKSVVDSDTADRLKTVERSYHARFADSVGVSNRYRKILYAWSLVLLVAVAIAGLQLKRLYANLEQRVLDRTAELRKALAALWGEMKLARKIQEALVPEAPMLDRCEVAVKMKPTDEVGGDYYDVVRTKKNEWILIGDVSGHGVPAGLIMMMCHTAVRTVLRSDPEIMPDKLLSMVNTVLTENIRQLGEDKYMTINALRRDADGTIWFAGAHQDIFVYRARTDSVETLETAGIWLGLKDEVSDVLTSAKLELLPGDVLMLYTDGITEAVRDGALFDTGGLFRILENARGKSAQQVLDDLFTELTEFKLSDDATVLVIRQLDAQGRAFRSESAGLRSGGVGLASSG